MTALFPFTGTRQKGALLFELSATAMDREFLYFTAMGSGVGSTELFADRSSLGERSQLCRFRRVGPKVLMIAENTSFRAPNGSVELQTSVDASFPTVVLAAMPIEAEQNGTLVVNANPLIVRDAFDLVDRSHVRFSANNGEHYAVPCRAGRTEVEARYRPQRGGDGAHALFSVEHRGRGAPDLHCRKSRGQAESAGAANPDGARASFLRAVAGCGLRAA